MKAEARGPADAWLSASEASRLLGVTRATLYAYVSRGFVRSQASSGASRERTYARDDVERLRRRTEERRAPDKAAARALQWGMPILESAITLIDGRMLYYRGRDATALARTRSLEDVAAFIWTGTFGAPGAAGAQEPVKLPKRRMPFTARAQSMLATAAADDHSAFDLRAPNVALTG